MSSRIFDAWVYVKTEAMQSRETVLSGGADVLSLSKERQKILHQATNGR